MKVILTATSPRQDTNFNNDDEDQRQYVSEDVRAIWVTNNMAHLHGNLTPG
jgi:hypothetical protein